jgi:HK97 family phage major capsid protein
MYDFRELQAKAEYRQKQVEDLLAKDAPTDGDRDLINSLMGEIKALEMAAGEMKDAEILELRAMVARGTAPEGMVADPHAQSLADFKAYLKTGDIKNASMSTTDANGGYLVPEPAHAKLIEKIRSVNPIFGMATHFPMSGDTTLQLPYKSAHGAVTNALEAGARSEQNAPTFTSPSLTCYDYYTDQRATQQYLDSVAGAEDQLVQWIYEDMLEQAEVDAASGDGTTKIKGLFSCTSEYTADLSTTANALNNTCWLSTYFKLPLKYRRDAVWLMAPATLGVAAAYADPASASIKLATLQGEDWYIYGKKVVECDSAPAIGNGLYPVAFGSVKAGFAVGTHRNTSILRDPYTAVPKIRFYGLARLGGCAWDYQAIRLIKSDDA